jgi:hypothetical protein
LVNARQVVGILAAGENDRDSLRQQCQQADAAAERGGLGAAQPQGQTAGPGIARYAASS